MILTKQEALSSMNNIFNKVFLFCWDNNQYWLYRFIYMPNGKTGNVKDTYFHWGDFSVVHYQQAKERIVTIIVEVQTKENKVTVYFILWIKE